MMTTKVKEKPTNGRVHEPDKLTDKQRLERYQEAMNKAGEEFGCQLILMVIDRRTGNDATSQLDKLGYEPMLQARAIDYNDIMTEQ